MATKVETDLEMTMLLLELVIVGGRVPFHQVSQVEQVTQVLLHGGRVATNALNTQLETRAFAVDAGHTRRLITDSAFKITRRSGRVCTEIDCVVHTPYFGSGALRHIVKAAAARRGQKFVERTSIDSKILCRTRYNFPIFRARVHSGLSISVHSGLVTLNFLHRGFL